MGENLDSAVNSLGEQTKRFEIANYYTHGDIEKSKEMIAGNYKDLFVIKISFSSSVYGAMLIFLNHMYLQVSSLYVIVSQSFEVGDIKTTLDWKLFEKSITELREKKEHDDVLGNHLKEALGSGLTMDTCNKLKSLIETNDAIAVNHLFQKLLQDKTGFQRINISVDYSTLSSLDMELLSTSSNKINPNDLLKKEEPKPEEPKKDETVKDDDPLGGKEVKLVLKGSVILSPIKGKEIKHLVVGDRIRISIVDSNPKAVSVAKAFNALTDEGKYLPINGRVVSIKYDEKLGYKIFVVIAKGIFIKIEEEEKNIKIAMDDSIYAVHEQSVDTPVSVPLIIGLAFILIILIVIIVIFIK